MFNFNQRHSIYQGTRKHLFKVHDIKVKQRRQKYYLVVVVLPDPFRGKGAWRNSTETQQSGHSPRSGPEVKMIPDDWGRPDGRAPQGSCLAISAHFSNRGAGTAPPR